MYVLKIFITGDISPLALLALLMSLEIGQYSCLRHAIGIILNGIIINSLAML